MVLSDEEIIKYYKDPKFPGSFAGASTFQTFLKTELNENIPLSRIYNILKLEDYYIMMQRSMKRFPRRIYDVQSFGELFQAGKLNMVPYNNYLSNIY